MYKRTFTALYLSSTAFLLGLNGLTPGQLSAAPFQNGSFEIGSSDPGSDLIPLGGGSNVISSWTVLSAGVDYVGGFWQAAQGSRSLDLSGCCTGGEITQSFDTNPGTLYRVLFALAGNPGGPPGLKQGTVRAFGNTSGVVQPFAFDSVGHSYADMGWVDMSYLFLADSSTTTLEFLSTTSGPYGPALDNVRVTAVPLPGSLGMLGGGLAILIGWARRGR